MCLGAGVAVLLGAEFRRIHRGQVAEQRHEFGHRDRLAAQRGRLEDIGVDGSLRYLLHGPVLGCGLAPEGLGLLVAEPERHSHGQMIPHGISRAWEAWMMWVPKSCVTWPDALLAAGHSAPRQAPASPVLACRGVG